MADALDFLKADVGKYIYIKRQDTYEVGTQGVERVTADEVVLLSSTTDFRWTNKADVTTYPVGDGTSNSDHVRNYGAELSFSGVISDSLFGLAEAILGVAATADAATYVELIKEIYQNSSLVTINFPDGLAEQNCILTNISMTRDVKHSNGFKVDISARKIVVKDSTLNTVAAVTAEAKVAEQVDSTVSPENTSLEPRAAINP